jgi:hypothetical protein
MRRHRSSPVRALLLILALSCAALAAVAQNLSRGSGSLRVMNYNVFMGTSFGPIRFATDLPSFVAAVGAVLAEVRASQPDARMQAVARQIAAATPTVISLQEVNRWRSGVLLNLSPLQCGPMSTEFDLLQGLRDSLAALGADYRLAAQVTQMSIPALPGQLPTGELRCVGLDDRNALLVRGDIDTSKLQWRNAQSGLFAAALPVPTPLGTVPFTAGWMSIDVTFFNRNFRLVGAHLTVEPTTRRLQGIELRAIAATSALPVAIAMDSNAQAAPLPLDPTYTDFIGEGYADGWSVAAPDLPGFTCCQPQALSNAVSQLFQRVDLILTRGGAFEARNGALFGVSAASKTASGLWPSDHAGVAVQYEIEATP